MSVAGPDRIEAWLDNELSDEGFVEFEDWLRSDPANIETFARAGILHRRLRDVLRAQAVALESEDEPPIIKLSTLPSLSTTHNPLFADFVGGPVFSYMVASVILCMMLLGGWVYKVSHITSSPGDLATSSPIKQQYALDFIGQITVMKDCRWGKDEPGTIVGASVPLGRKYELTSGLLEITYTGGARVILEGPCSYTVNSEAGGYLGLGRLTARIEKRGEKSEERREAAKKALRANFPVPSPQSPAPLFSVTTPTAVVTDLGTEFGVEVNEQGDTSTHVFRGVVKVKIASLSGDKRGEGGGSVILRTDESARVEKDKTAVARLLTNVAIGDSAKFVRLMPRLSRINNFAFGKDSADFTWKYEMDVDPTTQDLDANPGPDWMLRFGAFQLNGDGTATLAASGERYGCLSSTGPGDFEHSAGHVWNNITESTGYTVELRIKVVGTVQWQGYELGMYFMTVDSTAEEYSHLVIARNNTLWDVNSRYLIDNHSNDDDFHTFRIAQAPNSGKFYVWRDCVLIRISEGFQSTRLNRIQFGDMGPRCGPNVVDYVRLTTGAHAPPKRAASPPMNTRPDNRKEAPSTINH